MESEREGREVIRERGVREGGGRWREGRGLEKERGGVEGGEAGKRKIGEGVRAPLRQHVNS